MSDERRAEAVALLATGDLINQMEAARLIGISKSTLSYRTRMGVSPAPVGKIGKSVVYWRSDVIAARASRTREEL